MKKTLTLLGTLLILGCFGQSVIYVDGTATGTNDGTNWNNAFMDLQLALEAARAGDEIWVAKGIYRPSKDSGNVVTSPKRKFFTLIDSVKMYGGFAGTETQRNQRDWVNNSTVLSGDIGVVGDTTDNSLHVVYSLGKNLSSETVLDGFVMRDGVAYRNYITPQEEKLGGGIYIEGDFLNLVLSNLRIINNYAERSGGGCVIRSEVNLNVPNPMLVVMANCKIKNNSCGGLGGGFYSNWTRFLMINSEISNNYAESEYGAYVAATSASTIVNSTIFHNRQFQGAAVAHGAPVKAEYYNCIIDDSVGTYTNGGALPSYRSCIFLGSGGSQNWVSAYGIDLGGNMDVNPDLTANYRLKYNSPGRNAGWAGAIPFDTLDLDNDGITNEPIGMDLAGNPRIMGPGLDIGAYEYLPAYSDSTQTTICRGDQTFFQGQSYDTPGIYTHLLGNSSGQDSVAYLFLTVDTVDIRLDTGLFGASYTAMEDSASYQWIDCNTGLPLPGDTLPTFTPTQNGSYAVEITNDIGCMGISACITIDNVGLREIPAETRFSIYPNPADKLLNIKWTCENCRPTYLSLLDLSGRVLRKELIDQSSTNEIVLATDHLKNGVYFIRIGTDILRFVKSDL